MSRLTLDEAITHCKEKSNCSECGKDHEQLAVWLAELQRYKNLKEQGRLIELPCKLKNAIDVIFSHNEIVTLMCDGVDKNGTRCHLHFWHGMAWNIPKEYLELQFVKIHGVVSDKPDTLYVEVDAKFTSEAAEAKLAEMEGAK